MRGSEWIKQEYKQELSPLGGMVADLLEAWEGLHHLRDELKQADFSNDHHVVIKTTKSLETFDFNNLTRLVFLAHWFCLRVELNAKGSKIEILFHHRERTGSLSHRHPTLDQAVADFKATMIDNPEA